ncbi:glycosyltransferase family 2 protein [Cloacibacillus sp. An23]|uniref:glycosyltransferase family 2 protein n=1 Tax=Cloacibacillus sp. An23 TaxID=1965591 RepID=UPI001EF6B41F|nr:glycosyltransferase family 2 protein [Cloacibacillus sp. An23]
MPVYKTEKYLEQCVQSIIAQSFKDFELILVDDGSPDNCPHICDKYAESDSRIYVIHKINGGLVSARQAGVAIATGKYVVCVDSDDWIDNNYLEKFAEIIYTYGVDIVCCGATWIYNNRKVQRPIPMQIGLYDQTDIEKKIYPQLIESKRGVYFAPSLWAKAFRRTIYQQQQLLVDSYVSVGEDHACVKPCIYRAQSLYILPDCLYNYRQNMTSMTKNKKPFDWNGPRIIGQHFERQIDMNQYDFQSQVYRNVVHNLFNVCVSQFNRDDKYTIIALDIRKQISSPYYRHAIIKSSFKRYWKGTFVRFVLLFKITEIIWLYHKYICKRHCL